MPAVDVTHSRPEHGKRETLKRLLAVSRREFAAKGLAGARVDAIAQQAGVTKQLVYHYFGSKEALFANVLDESSFDVMSELLSLDIDDLEPPDAILFFLDAIFTRYKTDKCLGSLAQEGIRYHENHSTPANKFIGMAPALVAKLDLVLKRGARRGDFKPGIDARLFLATAALITSGGFTNRYSVSSIVGFCTTSEEGMAAWHRHAADFIMAAIRAR